MKNHNPTTENRANISCLLPPRLVLAGSLALLSLVSSRAGNEPIEVFLTTGNGTSMIAPQPAIHWTKDIPADAVRLRIHDGDVQQPILGFGASLVTPYLDEKNVTPKLRAKVLGHLFDPKEGLGLGVVRVPLFKVIDDKELVPDEKKLTPAQSLEAFRKLVDNQADTWEMRVVKEARAMNPDLRIIGTPWSAPGFMKDTKHSGKGHLLPEYYEDYADLIVRWVKSWQKAGIPVYGLTLQNEPQFEPGWYSGMRMEVPEQIAFSQVLGRALQRAGLNTKLLAHDHNWDNPEHPTAILDSPEASEWLAGAAFHGYAGDPENIRRFRDAHPDKEIHGTELTGSFPEAGWEGSLQWQTTRVMQMQLFLQARTAMTWQLFRICGTESGDRPIVRIHPGEGNGTTLYGEYAVLGHFSKFIQRGARRLGTVFPGGKLPYLTAFRNPDGTKIAVANVWGPGKKIAVEDGGRAFVYEIPENGVVTFRWKDEAPAPPQGQGLHAQWFDSAELFNPALERLESTIDFDLSHTPPGWGLGRENVSARWTGLLRSPSSGPVRLLLTSDDGSRLFIGDRLVIQNWKNQDATTKEAVETLGPEGTWVPVTIEFGQGKGNGLVNLSWAWDDRQPVTIPREAFLPEKQILPGEGDGLTLSIQDGSRELLRAVEPTLERDWTLPLPKSGSAVLSAVWTGRIIADRTGRYQLKLETDTAASLSIDGEILRSRHATARSGSLVADLDLKAGESREIRITSEIDRAKAAVDNSGVTLLWRFENGPWQVVPRRQLASR